MGAAELGRVDAHAGELGDHRRTADERVGIARHHDEIGEPEQQRRARHRRTRHREHDRDDARAIGQGPSRQSPPVEGGHPLDDVGATRRDVADERDPFGERDVRGDRDRLPVVGAQGALAVGRVDLEHDRRSPSDVVDPRGDAASGSGPDRDSHRHELTTVQGWRGANPADRSPGPARRLARCPRRPAPAARASRAGDRRGRRCGERVL